MASIPLYRRKSAAIDKRVGDLLRRMTLEEKVAQLESTFRQKVMGRDANGHEALDPGRIERTYPHGLGRICAMMHSLSVADGPRTANALQRVFLEYTRLKIPVLFDCEALHGCVAPGSTSYPQAIGLAATWNPALLEEIDTAIGREVRA